MSQLRSCCPGAGGLSPAAQRQQWQSLSIQNVLDPEVQILGWGALFVSQWTVVSSGQELAASWLRLPCAKQRL